MEKIKNIPAHEKIYIEYMGCPPRALDARRMADYFLKNGVMISKTPKDANYILFISCAFRNTDENFTVKRIKELNKYKAKLILGGCLKAINHELLDEFFQGPSIGTSDINEIDQLFPRFLTKFREIPDTNRLSPSNELQLIKLYANSIKKMNLGFLKPVNEFIKRKDHRQYWYVRAAWGCTKEHCSYCSVWKAVGELKSKSLDDCVKEFEEGLRCGYANILITADNLGAYGLDINLTLPNLLERLTKIEGSYKMQLENIHPYWLIKYLVDLLPFFRHNKIRAILCPIQSGNNRILSLMNRRYEVEQAKASLSKIKEICPAIELYTQIIVGFPSETELELEETLACVKEMDFNLVHISGYHRRPHAASIHLAAQETSQDIIRQRIDKAVKFFKKNKIGYFAYPE